MLPDIVVMKFDFRETEFLSSAIKAADDECDTSSFYGLAKVSFGAACCYDFGDFVVYFNENIIS